MPGSRNSESGFGCLLRASCARTEKVAHHHHWLAILSIHLTAMGIKSLMKVIADNAPDAIIEGDIKNYFGRRVSLRVISGSN